MTITRAEYYYRGVALAPHAVLTHRLGPVGDVFSQAVMPAPVPGVLLDESLLMLRWRREAYDESMRLRHELWAEEAA